MNTTDGILSETETQRRLFQALELCMQIDEMGAASGPSGAGKSTAVEAFRRERGDAVMIVTVRAQQGTPQGVFQSLAEGFGMYQAVNPGYSVLFNDVKERIKRDRCWLLVIDEAQRADDKALDALVSLWEETKVAIFLLGTLDLGDRWQNPKSRSYKPFESLRSRLACDVLLSSPSEGDADAICDAYAVRAQKARAAVRAAVAKPGGLHNARQLFKLARYYGEGQLTEESVLAAARLSK